MTIHPPHSSWSCRFPAPESAWMADSVLCPGEPRSAAQAAVEFARARIAQGGWKRAGMGIVECQGNATVYYVRVRWEDDEVSVVGVDVAG